MLKEGSIFVELGAGRGMLSLMIEHFTNNVNNIQSNRYVLIDRGKNRFKV